MSKTSRFRVYHRFGCHNGPTEWEITADDRETAEDMLKMSQSGGAEWIACADNKIEERGTFFVAFKEGVPESYVRAFVSFLMFG